MNPGMHLSFWICVFVLDIYLGVELLGDVVVLFLFFWETFRLFCAVAVPIYIPTNSAQSSLFSASQPQGISEWLPRGCCQCLTQIPSCHPRMLQPTSNCQDLHLLAWRLFRAMGFPQTYRVGWKERVGNSYPWAPSTKNWWDCVLSHSVMSNSLWPHGL